MLPLYGDNSSKGSLMKTIAKEAEVEEESILDTDLFLYNRMNGTKIGSNEEYISSPRLDDLECAFTSLSAFLSENTSNSASGIVYLTMKKWEVELNKGQIQLSYMMSLEELIYLLGKLKRIIIG